MGVAAMLEAADLVLAGKHTETIQDESQARYEGWCKTAEAKIDWAKPIRSRLRSAAAAPRPAHGPRSATKLQIFDA